MANKIGAKIVLDGEAEYRKALKNIGSEQKELRSEMKLVSSQFSDQQNSLEALTKKGEVLTKQYDAQSRKVEIYSKAVADASAKQEEAGEKVDTLKSALDAATKEMDEMAKSSDTSADALKEQQATIDDLKNKLLLAQDGYDKAQRSTNDWKTSLNDAQVNLTNLQNEIEQNNTHIAEAEKSYDNCATTVDEYGNAIDDAKDKTITFADIVKAELVSDIIKKGVEEIAEGIKQIATAAIDVGSTFEHSMSQVAATMGMTSTEVANGCKDYETLKKAAEDSGKATKYSASQAAEALNYLALAGYDANKAAETLPKVLNLAAAGGMELSYASDLVTDSMAALGMETEDLDNYIDQMAKTSQKSNTSVAQLGEATLVCAGTVSMTKQPLETMNAELGVLANNGIKGAEGGTHLRNILMSLVSPTDAGAQALKKYGVEVSDSVGNVRDLNDIMTDLNSAIGNLSDAEKTNVISKIFNKTDISSVNALLKGTGDEFNKLKDQISNCDGAASDMAETMEANLTGKITILESALEGLGISAYDKIEGTLKEAVDSATDSVGRLQESMDNGKLGKSMDNFADALGDAADGAISFAEDALPIVIDGLSWIMDNSELVIAGIGGITTATITHSTVIPAITGVMEAWKAYKTANENATVAQYLLNGAMEANPAGILLTAIVGLTSALGIYLATTGGLKSETQKLADAVAEENKNLQNSISTRKESQDSQKAEIATIGSLKDELLDLNAKETLTNDEKTRMKMIVDELNEAMPNLNLAIDEQSGYLMQTNEEVEAYVDNMQRAMELEFMQEDLTDIARDHYDAKKNLTEIQDEYNNLVQKAADYEAGWKEACEQGIDAMNDYAGTMGAGEEAATRYASVMNSYQKAIDDLTPSLEDAQKLEQNLQEEYDTTSKKLDESTKKMGDAKEATDNLNTSTIQYKDKTYEVSTSVAGSIETIQQAYADAWKEADESISGQIGLFDQLSVKSDLTAAQMATNLKSQTDTFNTYSADLQTAADLASKGLLDEGLLGAIMELGIDGAGYLHELVTAAQDDSDAFAEIMDEWATMESAKLTLVDTFADIQTDYSDQMNLILGIQEEKNDSMEQELSDTSDNILQNVEDSLEEMVTTTSDGLEDMTKAVKTETPAVHDAAVDLCSAAIEGANTTLGINEEGTAMSFVSIGYSIPQGVAQGITEGQDLISNALQNAIDHAIDSIDLSGITAKINRELGDLY